MKTIIFVIVYFCYMSLVMAKEDTLRHYDPATVGSLTYTPLNIVEQVARFKLPRPALIKAIVVKLNGNTGDKLKMHLYGHEAGTSYIQLYKDVMAPVILTKTQNGVQRFTIKIETRNISFRNNYFYVGFDEFSSNRIRPVSDVTNHQLACSSTNGGDYSYQIGLDNTHYNRPLHEENRAFAVDVVLEYESEKSQNIFVDVTTKAGIATNLSNTTIAAADYNNDKFIDLLIRGKLYKNNKNGTFTDVTDTMGITGTPVANAIIDIDRDGDMDILFIGGAKSYVFVRGKNTFTKKELNLPAFTAVQSFSIADINFDGYPDLYTGQLWGTYSEAKVNQLFINNKNLGFVDSTIKMYPEYDGVWNWPSRRWDPANYIIERNRNTRGSQWVDFDNDGDMDLYVANYFLHPDELLQNNGDGSFTDIAKEKKLDLQPNGGSGHGSGVDWYDFNNDGNMDLLLPQLAHPYFIAQGYDFRGTLIYRNEGKPDYSFTDLVGKYQDDSGLVSDIGIEMEETHAGGAWGDVNNDGLADFALTVFYGCRYVDLYEQQSDNRFVLKTFDYGLEGINTGADLVWLDYNNDGKLDLGVARAGKFRLYKNSGTTDNKYIEIDLCPTKANTNGTGSRVEVYAGGKQYTQEVSTGHGAKMQDPYRLHFGLGGATVIDSLIVYWPNKNRKRENFKDLSVSSIYELHEGGEAYQIAIDGDRIVPTFVLEKSETNFTVMHNQLSGKLSFEFSLISEGNVKIKMYNIASQKEEVVFNGFLTSGYHHFDKNINHKNRGVYFFTLYAEGKRSTRKVALSW
ncbi:MAG: CRTAC1 family protein [Fibrobacteria bacterium]|nr:CRTAC1 family protein [Fibrobacteria bacterium]